MEVVWRGWGWRDVKVPTQNGRKDCFRWCILGSLGVWLRWLSSVHLRELWMCG